jgi:hypothetical protein
MANIIRYALILILLIPGSAFSATVWPDVYGHGAMWQLKDAPGSGTPILCVVNSLDDGTASGSENTDYNGTGQSVYEGNARYCNEMENEDGSGNPNGKVILAGINGWINNDQSPWIWYWEANDWTIADYYPPGITDGIGWRNIKISPFDTNEDDEELTHFFLKDFRGMHGAGANGVDGGSNNTATGIDNRKPMSFSLSESDQVLNNIVAYKSTFVWGLDGPFEVGGEASASGTDAGNFTVDSCLIGNGIAYTKQEDWTSGHSYTKWAIVDNSTYTYPTVGNGPGYYECTQAHTASAATEPGTGASWESYWREIDYDMTDKHNDSWKGMTNEAIDGFTVRRSIFTHNAQRNPYINQMGIFNVDNNIIYNAKSLGAFIATWDSGSGEDDWMKGTLVGNVAIGGPHSGASTDENFPTLWVYTAGWYANVLSSNTSMTSQTNTTLCDTSKDWDDDEFNGYEVRIVDGTGEGQDYKTISDTNGTTECITIDEAWDTNPTNTSDYEIVDLSDHDVYVADTRLIECDSTPCDSNYTVRQQDSLGNEYDWDYVDNDEEIPESAVKHTSVPTGAHVSGYTPMDDDDVEDALLAQDGTGAGAYNDNQDTVTAAIFTAIKNRTEYQYKLTSIDDADYPTLSATGAVALDIPDNLWGLCDDGYYRIEYWLHNDGDMTDCTSEEPEEINSPAAGYHVNAGDATVAEGAAVEASYLVINGEYVAIDGERVAID